MNLMDGGSAIAPRIFFDTKGLSGRGMPDGLKTDAAENLWATGPGGLIVISSQAKLLGRVLTHRPTSNVAFGGEDGSLCFRGPAQIR